MRIAVQGLLGRREPGGSQVTSGQQGGEEGYKVRIQSRRVPGTSGHHPGKLGAIAKG